MSRVEYRNGRATQVLGTIYLSSLEGDFDKVVSSIQKEHEYYKKEFVKKAGEVRGIYADMPKPGGGLYYSQQEEKRTLKFDRIYLDLVDVHDYDGERKEWVVYGERAVAEVEQAALDAEENARLLAQKERDRVEFERLKAQFDKAK